MYSPTVLLYHSQKTQVLMRLGVRRNYPSISYPSIIWVAVYELKQVTIIRKPCYLLYTRIMETSCKFINSNPVIAFFHSAAEKFAHDCARLGIIPVPGYEGHKPLGNGSWV